MPAEPEKKSPPKGPRPVCWPARPPGGWGWCFAALAVVLYFSLFRGDGRSDISYGFFIHELKAKNIQSVEVIGSTVNGEFRRRGSRSTPSMRRWTPRR